MRKDIAELWIKELDSGLYDQTCGTLLNENGYCCLGVLCQTIVKHQKEIDANEGIIAEAERCLRIEDTLSHKIQNFCCMKSKEGMIHNSPVGYTYLSNLNDDEGFNFNSIARVIRENIEVL